MATVLITGCAGFIGSHLCERLLREEYRVIGIDNFDPFYPRAIKEANLAGFVAHPRFTFHEADVRHGPVALAANISEPVDVVVHLAAKAGVGPSLREPAAYLETNLLGTTHVLEWMREHEVRRLVFASSSSVYGNTPEQPFREAAALRGLSPYAASKIAAEELTFTYHHLYAFSVLCTRFFTVYGPRQRPDLAIHKFARLLRAGRPVPVFGDGHSSRDYTFVADTVDGVSRAVAYLLAHETPVYEALNLGNHHPVPLLQLIEAVGTAVGVEPQLDFRSPQPGDVEATYADIRKAHRLLGYEPRTTLSEGLRQFVAWLDAGRPQRPRYRLRKADLLY
ncbi:SDR family NAD(P)-dependent oxidoreductase [Hymenobacter sp. BT664]|uniref:SDR family NAD(P)-dependent oxidoreductase n=1 Tax=Hymenobacter montanus TaxID=2771359 RepID=A0A927BCP9_9BACT|nr:SDR family NAD(P)-dependent oxidoreductase [Hymenobacter montanus]MBD2767699.1 SDR family NAD(P)-dependent oxidoreductase [Hymenobacter montanus]